MTDWPFTSPVLTASGCGGTGRELAAYGELGALGGFVTRSITLHERAGARGPRLVETPSGLVNAIGLQNPGVAAFVVALLALVALKGATTLDVTAFEAGVVGAVALGLAIAANVGAHVLHLAADGGGELVIGQQIRTRQRLARRRGLRVQRGQRERQRDKAETQGK